MPDVAAVIGSYEGESHLPACLSSLAEGTQPPSETIVVDAGSRDRSREVAAAHGARVLEAPNRGLGSLYNAGARAARAPFVLLANVDVAFDRRCVELLAEALDADERRFAADPRQVAWEGGRTIHARAALRRGPLLRQPLPGFRLELNEPAAHVVPTLCANGGAMLVRRDRLLALGGFDETFFMDFEDLDLCWRAWLRGWSSVHVPDAWLRHRVGGVTSPDVLRRRLTSSHHNLLRFALKCLSPRNAARVAAGELLRLPAHPLLIAPALAAVLRELPEIGRERRRARPSAALDAWLLGGQRGPAPVSAAARP